MLSYPDIAKKNKDILSDISFSSEKTNIFKLQLLDKIDPQNREIMTKKNKDLINEISENCNVKMILKKKNKNEIEEILKDLIKSLKEIIRQKKIESFESKLINNLDESSFNEFIKLKTQINRD